MTITVLNILANGTQTLESREVPDDYFAVPQDGGQSAADETATAGGEAASGTKPDSETSTQ
ncbi:hypothetical protein [Oscillibacter ruminantium]|uniref:hypothetical protein n=1 Tax=Oscillibacter ruminantium TaxID=1263547 RepID=UPI0002D5A778|nr:hypothetical protein [Oscillibacter ruminantium]MDN0031325.1 hypothetical protein [Oscillibacter valericigenes]